MRKGEPLASSSFALGSIPARFNLPTDPLATPVNCVSTCLIKYFFNVYLTAGIRIRYPTPRTV